MRTTVVGAALAAVLLGAPGTASAHHQEFTPFPLNTTLLDPAGNTVRFTVA